MHESGFAGAGFTDDGDGFTFFDRKIDILEGFEFVGFFAVGFVKFFNFDEIFHYFSIRPLYIFCKFCGKIAGYWGFAKW